MGDTGTDNFMTSEQEMPIYRVRRHVVYLPGCQQTEEVWGIDRQPAALSVAGAPRFTDEDDPLLGSKERCGCPLLLKTACGKWVTWHRMWQWLSEAEAAGYELVSGYSDVSPYSTLIIRGP